MKHFLSFLSILLLIQFALFAQTDTIKATLSEVVVTATKTETPYYALGSSVTVITSEDISRKQLKTVVDLLKETIGLSLTQQGGPGKLASVFMRGANSNHTLVIVDGAEMNDPSSPNNAFDFSTLNTNDIARIEIVRGPQSTLYGSDALAGVINIITKRGNGKPTFSFSGEGGSNNYFRSDFSALGSLSNLSYAFFASKSGSNGISAANSLNGNTEKDGFSNNAFTSRLSYDLLTNMKLGFIYKFTNTKADLDQSAKNGDDPNFSYKQEEHLLKANINSSLLGEKWQQDFSTSFIKRFSNAVDLADQFRPKSSSDAFNNANRFKMEWQNNLHLIENNLITIGVETETETASTSYFSNGAWGPFNSVFPKQSIRTTGFYLQDQINISNSFFASLGLRYDKNEKFGGVTTYRIAPAYYFSTTGTKLKATYGTGFKAPSLFYLFDPMFGNPNLQPEKSKGWDFGFEHYFMNKNISLGITYFNLKFENMFGFDKNFRTVNIAKASSHGVEISASANYFQNLSLNGNYTFTEAKDEYEQSADFGKSLLRRPKHKLSLSANYVLNEKLNLNVRINYVGSRDDKDFSTFPAQRITMPTYTLVNLSASYKFLDYLELTVRIENLFDKQYEEVLYYGTLGRSFYAGMNLNF